MLAEWTEIARIGVPYVPGNEVVSLSRLSSPSPPSAGGGGPSLPLAPLREIPENHKQRWGSSSLQVNFTPLAHPRPLTWPLLRSPLGELGQIINAAVT